MTDSQRIPLVHLVMRKFDGVYKIVIFDEASSDRFFKSEHEHDRTEKGEQSIGTFFVVLPDRRCR